MLGCGTCIATASLVAAYVLLTSQNHVTLLSKRETDDFLRRDADGFVASLGSADMKTRPGESGAGYADTAASAGADFPKADAVRVRAAARAADALLATHSGLGVDGAVAASLPWNIAHVKPTYEMGLPHTRADIIFLSETEIQKRNLVGTLIHEKVHVYQRIYPSQTRQYLESAGYARWALRGAGDQANPDVDEWVYVHPKTKQPMRALHTKTSRLAYKGKKEHPYEEIAYAIEDQLYTRISRNTPGIPDSSPAP